MILGLLGWSSVPPSQIYTSFPQRQLTEGNVYNLNFNRFLHITLSFCLPSIPPQTGTFLGINIIDAVVQEKGLPI